jgi:hypothetical protein
MMIEDFRTMENNIRTICTAIIAVASVFSFWNTIRLWQKTYRPVLSAFVETSSSGNIATFYNLIIVNSGNRPAKNINLKLNLNDQEFAQCVTQDINSTEVTNIRKCFSKEAEISLLVDGSKKSAAFGLVSARNADNIWKYESVLPIEITYQDLDDKHYKSKLNLIIKDSKSFSGISWVSEYDRKDGIEILKQILDSVK